MEKITVAFELLEQFNLELDLWQAQNIYFSMARKIYPDISSQSDKDVLAQRWVAWFERLGDILDVKYEASLIEGAMLI